MTPPLSVLFFARTRSPWPCLSCLGRSCTYHPRARPCCAVSLSVSRGLCFLSFWLHKTSALSTAAQHPAACPLGPPASGLVSRQKKATKGFGKLRKVFFIGSVIPRACSVQHSKDDDKFKLFLTENIARCLLIPRFL